jgi:DNA-directed RNA polymerase III subunit RPC6
MAASASQMASTINRIFDLFTTFSDGLTDKIMEENLKDVDLNVRAQALNALLQKRQLQIFKQGDFIVYKQQTKEESVRFKGLSSEDMLIYQAIKNAGNMGIWTKDMKRETNLQQPQVNKALKNLEARGLIKGVKCVSNQAKKVYMLAELTPSKEITGGAWYTGQNFDTEFTNIVKQQCLQFVLQQGVATIESVADFVRKSGISKVELKVEELKQILDMLVLDGDVEEVISTGTGDFAAIPINKLCYRGSQARIQESSAFTNIPCGVCPVLRECTDDGLISPKTCIYYKKWLTF